MIESKKAAQKGHFMAFLDRFFAQSGIARVMVDMAIDDLKFIYFTLHKYLMFSTNNY